MHKHLFFVLLLIICFSGASAQNILRNPNFVEKYDCPQYLDELFKCKYWRSPTKSTPGYYNSCYDTIAGMGPGPGVPQSWWAYQHSNDNAYVGIYGLHYGGYREYIATTFSPLIPGETYRVSMRISLADSVAIASAGLGVYFYKDAVPDYHTHGRIFVMPQVDYTHYGIIVNDTEWVSLVGTFVADSAYTNLVIGNFHSDTDVMKLSVTIRPGKKINYYLIDSVALEMVEDAGIGIYNAVTATIAVYPNPAGGRYTFSFGRIADYNLTLYNAVGVAVVKKEHVVQKDITIERGSLPAGHYFYTAETAGSIAGRGRILLE
jgi:hypothetical protein